jgi:hypothetical protein
VQPSESCAPSESGFAEPATGPLLANLETRRVVGRHSLRQAQPEDLLPHGCENRGGDEDVGAAEDQSVCSSQPATADRRRVTRRGRCPN